MSPDAPYRREHVVDVDAAVVGISRADWARLTPGEADDPDAARETMARLQFDVMPVDGREGAVEEYLATDVWGEYGAVGRHRIGETDTLPYRTPLDEAVRALAERGGRPFLFLTRYGRVTGLLTVAHLNSRQSRTFFYSLISELEMAMARLVRQAVETDRVTEADVVATMRDKIREPYEAQREANVDADPTEYFYLTDFKKAVYKLGLHRTLGFTGRDAFMEPLGRLAGLRDRVAHPARALVGSPESVSKLWRDVEVLDDLLARLREAAPPS